MPLQWAPKLSLFNIALAGFLVGAGLLAKAVLLRNSGGMMGLVGSMRFLISLPEAS